MASDPLSTSKKKKLKFLCSYGGEILPRPRDRKLRYVGGVMRIIQISPDCSWEEFRQQMAAMYGKPHTIKYQLPGLGEDFHRLLLVSDDEELEDMMEYGVVDGGGSQKLINLFLFPLDEDVDAHLSLTLEGDSRAHYLSAVNGVAMENRASRGFHSEPSNFRSRAAPRTQRSGPAALEDGLIEFEKEVKHANSVARSSKSMLVQNPSLGESISEYSESGFEDDEERIIDTAVGKIDLRHMQEMSDKDLKAVKVLGSGGFGTVYHGKWKGKDVAIKRINKGCFPGRQSEKEIVILETFKEAGILSKLQHPNIVSLYGFTQDESGSSISIVMELVLAGSLRNILDREDKFLDHRKRLLIAKGAASGMDYLHLRNVVHFDLKCDNLLVDLEDPSRPVCKVTDFGLSKVKQNTLISGGFRGTLPYMAPELLRRGKNKVSEKVDVYSFGIVMWEILTGGVPYDGMGPGDIMVGVPDNTLRPPVPASCDPQWRRLMEQCWDCDPKLRPSFNEIARRLNLMLLARS